MLLTRQIIICNLNFFFIVNTKLQDMEAPSLSPSLLSEMEPSSAWGTNDEWNPLVEMLLTWSPSSAHRNIDQSSYWWFTYTWFRLWFFFQNCTAVEFNMILLHLKTFWEGSISFTKLPGVHSREKIKTAFIWHVPDRNCCSGWVLDRRPQGAEQYWVWETLGGAQQSSVALRWTLSSQRNRHFLSICHVDS